MTAPDDPFGDTGTRIQRGADQWGLRADEDPRLDDDALPMAGRPRAERPLKGGRVKRVKFRDLPRGEQVNRKVIEIVTYHWGKTGTRLTISGICKYSDTLAEDEVRAALMDPVVIANFRDAGIVATDADTYYDDQGTPLLPTTEQVNAVDRVLDLVDPDQSGSFPGALRQAGITTKQWRGWMRDPLFAGYVRDASQRLFGDHEAATDIALLRQAVAGNVPALRLTYELSGRLAPQQGNAADMVGIVSRLLEILARRLDPATLSVIAEDLEAVTGGTLGQNLPILELEPAPAVEDARE